MNFVTNIIKWMFDPKNRSILLLIIGIVFALLYLQQCNATKRAEQESKRIQNNWDASQDTIKQYLKTNGAMHGEIQAYQLTLDELATDYKDLFGDLDEWKKTPPKTIIKTTTEITEVIKYVTIKVDLSKDGSGKFTFKTDTLFSDGNSRSLVGLIPFQQQYYNKKDSTEISLDSLNYFSKPNPGLATFDIKQNISLLTGLSYDKKTKKPIIWVETKYPGVKFTEIAGADIIDNNASMDALKKTRKTWGIGFQVGYGIGINNPLKLSPYVGVGVSYTPKFLQF